MLAEEAVVMTVTEGEEGLFGNNKNGDTVNAALGWMYYFNSFYAPLYAGNFWLSGSAQSVK